jgi:hypothetical protein
VSGFFELLAGNEADLPKSVGQRKQLIEGEYCSFVSMQAAAYEPYFEIHPVDNLVINGGSARLRRNLAE